MTNSTRKHVLIFIEIYCGPTMTFVHRQVEELMKTFDVTLVSNKRENINLYPGSPVVVPFDLISRLMNKTLKFIGKTYCVAPLALSRTIKDIHRAKKVDGVICHFGPAGLQIAKILEKLEIPQSIIIHGYDGSSLLKYNSYLSQICTCTKAKWIFASESLRDNFLSKVPILTKYKTIHLGLEIEEIDNETIRIPIRKKVKNGEKIVFFQAANFVEKKGHEFTVYAFKRFLETHQNAELLLAGNGPLFEIIQEIVNKHRLQSKIIFLGHLSSQQVMETMREADVFLHHSVTANNGDQESIPTVIMEAMSCGLPIISTYHGGIPELIESGKDGYLVFEKNIDEYSEAMIELLADDGEIGARAREKISQKYSFKKNLSRIVEFTLSR